MHSPWPRPARGDAIPVSGPDEDIYSAKTRGAGVAESAGRLRVAVTEGDAHIGLSEGDTLNVAPPKRNRGEGGA